MAHTWNSPNPKPFNRLALEDGEIRLGVPDSSDGAVRIAKDNLFRVHADAGSSSLSIAYRHHGVQLTNFMFLDGTQRDEALGQIERELGLHRSAKKSSGGWAQAVQPGLYLLVTLMITFGLYQGLAQGADSVDAVGRTAAKAGLLLKIGSVIGPGGVLIFGCLVAVFFLVRTTVALKSSGESVVLEPARV